MNTCIICLLITFSAYSFSSSLNSILLSNGEMSFPSLNLFNLGEGAMTPSPLPKEKIYDPGWEHWLSWPQWLVLGDMWRQLDK